MNSNWTNRTQFSMELKQMLPEYEVIDITPENEAQYDLFCKKSKKKEEGYQSKLGWFQERYNEGMRMKVLFVNERGKMTSRGFIEYIPGEYAWRVVHAPNFMVIHCLWVVGQWKKKGFGRMLLEACVTDAKERGMDGVAMVTNDGNWLTGKKILLKNGFEMVDSAPMGFELVVKRFRDVPNPTFPTNWDERQKRCGKGLTVFYSSQCPYTPEAVEMSLEAAKEEGVKAKTVHLRTAKELQEKSPSAYGVFGIVFDGKLVNYQFMKKESLQKILRS
ncbi:MAG: GNAT family N-acetyltransferase [Candidatus Thorarchaeota archaeon]